jgi:hypothetical protein
MEDHALRRYIRAKLENGHLLPYDSVPPVWGGPGNGETCDGCEEIIAKDQLVMKGVAIKGEAVRFHVKCFDVWAAEQMDSSFSGEVCDCGGDPKGPTRQVLKRRSTDIRTFSFPVPSCNEARGCSPRPTWGK